MGWVCLLRRYTNSQTLETDWATPSFLFPVDFQVVIAFYYNTLGKSTLQRYDIMERNVMESNAETSLSYPELVVQEASRRCQLSLYVP